MAPITTKDAYVESQFAVRNEHGELNLSGINDIGKYAELPLVDVT